MGQLFRLWCGDISMEVHINICDGNVFLCGLFYVSPHLHFFDSALPDSEDISMEMAVGRLVHINFWEGAMNFSPGSSRALPSSQFQTLAYSTLSL